MKSILSAFLLVTSIAAHAAEDRPNILFVMGDDWSWPHTGVLGDPVVKTPAFDRIAREGVLFNNAFVSSPSCTPSRLAVATGQWHWRLQDGKNLGGAIREGVPVYPDMLQAAGYQIGFAGKGAAPSDYRYTHRDPLGPRIKTFKEFIAQREAGKPFCFWYGPGDTHRPYRYGEGVAAGIDPKKVKLPACLPGSEVSRRDFADYLYRIQRFDSECARAVELLEKAGELNNTIVVISGDNGLPFPRCKATLYDTGTRVPLAVRWGAKVKGGRTVSDFVSLTDLAPTFLEAAGLKPPAVMTGRSLLPILTSEKSGQVDPDRTYTLTGMDCHVLANPCRALRTANFLYIRNFDPASWPTGEGNEPPPPISYTDGTWPNEGRYFAFNIDPSPTKQFLLDHREEPAVKPCYALACGMRPEEELFDLRADPDQLRNVAGDARHAPILAEMRKRLLAELLASGDPLLPPREKAVQPPRPVLQIINGSRQPIDVFWVKSHSERVSNGTVAPGKETYITTTLGHRFAIVGQEDKSEVTVTSEVPVQAFRFDPPDKDGVPAFYTQRVSANGFPIVASAKVNPYALEEAAYLVDLLLAKRPDVRMAMIRSGARLCILAQNEFTTDLPEFARLGEHPMEKFPELSGKEYWDARARGLGGSERDPFCSCGEENLLGYPGDPFAAECILIHEFAHNIHLRGLVNVDPTFDQRLKAAYNGAMQAGLWKGKYASVNHHEYFAEGVQSWFDDNRENDHDHNHVNTRAELVEYDPGLAAMCREVFGDTLLKYTKPATRLTGHLAGYDPTKAPKFDWPERLRKANELIKEAARAREREATKSSGSSDTQRPNVLFIAVDDLNDWTGCLGGHPQARTPNIDRLAASGVLFANAHCPAPACNPSRTAIMTGISPHKSGLYENRQKMREILPNAVLLPKYFAKHCYWAGGSGKLLHYFIDAQSWDEYFPAKETEDPFPRTLYPKKRPVSLPRGGPWQYIETDWGPLDATDEEFGGDWLVSKWIGEQLAKEHEKPFFLACGIYRPHEPWFVPKKYFDLFPIDDIQLPPGYREDDLDDLPPAGQRLGPNRYFAHIRAHNQWEQGIQGYLASIAFADAMVGRVIESLETGPNRDNTIVVLWSDHGWHLGEKQHWQKFTAWRACTRVPLIVRVPAGVPGLPEGTRSGVTCLKPVNLLSLFPTLTELAGLPHKADNDGPSLVPLLEDPDADWPHLSLTHLAEPGSYGLSTEIWRYIHYANGDEELYNCQTDRYEWTNLATAEKYAPKLAELRRLAPQVFAPCMPPKDESLPKLGWHSAAESQPPASRPDGNEFDIVLVNQHEDRLNLDTLDGQGKRESRGSIASGWRLNRTTRPGTVWLVTDFSDKLLGYFVVEDRSALAVIPEAK